MSVRIGGDMADNTPDMKIESRLTYQTCKQNTVCHRETLALILIHSQELRDEKTSTTSLSMKLNYDRPRDITL